MLSVIDYLIFLRHLFTSPAVRVPWNSKEKVVRSVLRSYATKTIPGLQGNERLFVKGFIPINCTPYFLFIGFLLIGSLQDICLNPDVSPFIYYQILHTAKKEDPDPVHTDPQPGLCGYQRCFR